MTRGVQPHYVTETQTLRRVANDPNCSWRFTTHSLGSMADDGWSADDVKHAVMNGRVVLQEQKQDILWRVEGSDVDGSQIRVVIAVFEREIQIKVITAF
jgi:hypothetical protein